MSKRKRLSKRNQLSMAVRLEKGIVGVERQDLHKKRNGMPKITTANVGVRARLGCDEQAPSSTSAKEIGRTEWAEVFDRSYV